MFQSDQEILEAIRTGERRDAALSWVYRECRPFIVSLAQKFDCSTDDCADAMQEAISTLYLKAVSGQLNLTARITTYVYQICKNQLLYRKRGSRSIPLAALEEEDALAEEESTEEELSMQEQQLGRLLGELGERCRTIIIEFYAGLSLKELATKYQYSSAETVSSQKHKCITQLRRKFQIA